MWRINYKRTTLQQVLIMAYMNVLEATSCAQAAGSRGVARGSSKGYELFPFHLSNARLS